MSDQIQIFDTTLRDGEQSPGVSLSSVEKLTIAQQLEKLGVDIIEAGFPITSPGDFEAVQMIARQVRQPVVCALARIHKGDIDRAFEAVREAERPRIHTFVSTSDIHIKHQMQSTREDVLGMTRAGVALAKSYCEDIEFSPMDATRADIDFTAEVCSLAISEGATVINIPDTVGYTSPEEYKKFLLRLMESLPRLGPQGDITLSVHCHNDLGLAVANSLAGIEVGARQAEVSINGIGERAGNCALEELVMFISTRADLHDIHTDIQTKELMKTSRLVSRHTGYKVQPNKASIGANAFAHESGIHQDGVLKEPSTFEIMDPAAVGLDSNSLVLGKHSGRHALKEALMQLGHELTGAELNTVFIKFKEIADRKKTVSSLDLEALLSEQTRQGEQNLQLKWFEISAGSSQQPRAQVILLTPNGERFAEGCGDGTIDALFAALHEAAAAPASLRSYSVQSVTEGEDALAEVTVVIDVNGIGYTGQGIDTDTVAASAQAYTRALDIASREQ